MTRTTAALALLLVSTIIACGPAASDGERAGASTRATADRPLEVGPDLQAKLAAADAADGAADGVVSLCPGCALAMEGSHEHALELSDYSLHFCSDDCRDHFAEDAEEALVALVVPEEDAAVDDVP